MCGCLWNIGRSPVEINFISAVDQSIEKSLELTNWIKVLGKKGFSSRIEAIDKRINEIVNPLLKNGQIDTKLIKSEASVQKITELKSLQNDIKQLIKEMLTVTAKEIIKDSKSNNTPPQTLEKSTSVCTDTQSQAISLPGQIPAVSNFFQR